MTKHTETQEYEVRDQWLFHNGRAIATLYGSGYENEIKRVLKILNNHDKLVEALKLINNHAILNDATYPMTYRIDLTYIDQISSLLSELDKDGEE